MQQVGRVNSSHLSGQYQNRKKFNSTFMKYLLVLCFLGGISCSPKYTASFQDIQKPVYGSPTMAVQQMEVVQDTLVDTAQVPIVVAALENKPTLFKQETLTDLQPDTVITSRQDSILLKNGDVVTGQIIMVTVNKLVYRVSEEKAAQSHSKRATPGKDHVIYLKDVFLINYANGTHETVNFTKMSDPTAFNPKRNRHATVGLILAILSFFPLYGVFLTPFAIFFSVLGLKSQKYKAAMTALVLASFGIILGLIMWNEVLTMTITL